MYACRYPLGGLAAAVTRRRSGWPLSDLCEAPRRTAPVDRRLARAAAASLLAELLVPARPGGGAIREQRTATVGVSTRPPTAELPPPARRPPAPARRNAQTSWAALTTARRSPRRSARRERGSARGGARRTSALGAMRAERCGVGAQHPQGRRSRADAARRDPADRRRATPSRFRTRAAPARRRARARPDADPRRPDLRAHARRARRRRAADRLRAASRRSSGS